MKLQGQCTCGLCKLRVEGAMEAKELQPRICDCEYCQQHPSAIISHPALVISFAADTRFYIAHNGSGQADFYHCQQCHQMLAVGAGFNDGSRGAVNGHLFGDLHQFGEPVPIQPWRLSPTEKAERWPKLWGRLQIS